MHKKETIVVNSIDELDDYFHKISVESANLGKSPEEIREKYKLVYGKDLESLGKENIYEALIMRSIEKALNDPYLNSSDECVAYDEEGNPLTFKNTIYPLLGINEQTTFH